MLVKDLIISSTIYVCHEAMERFLLVKSVVVWFSWRMYLSLCSTIIFHRIKMHKICHYTV